MKGRHISRNMQRKLRKPPISYSALSVPELIKLRAQGDQEAHRMLRIICAGVFSN
jgi:hypothetical protein